MSMHWNGVELSHAPIIRKRSLWEQWNDKLEELAIPAIWPCLIGGWIAGLQFA